MAEPVRRALLSVWDKNGLADFARGLSELGITLLATGGTAELLRREGLRPEETRDLTGFGSLLGGRVKTLHPRVHAGILARRDRPDDLEELRREGIRPIDMVVVNFYPFPGLESAREMDFTSVAELIDIGGPAILRGAAKNSRYVVPVSRPEQYGRLLEEMRLNGGEVGGSTRFRLASDAFAMAAAYDHEIARYLATLADRSREDASALPETLAMYGPRSRVLAYGENPHQQAAFYLAPGAPRGLAAMEVLGGKPLSYNNLLDAEALWKLLGEFSDPAAVIIKHNTPCGAAIGRDGADALGKALACDREAAFGGVVGLNCELGEEAVEILGDLFLEVLAFPGAAPSALERLRERKRLRLLRLPRAHSPAEPPLEVRTVSGGYLVQTGDPSGLSREEMRAVSQRQPTAEEWRDLLFAWRVAKHVRSNAIVLARREQTVGIGGGQVSRVDAVRLAVQKAERGGLGAAGSVLASDGFFPFSDSVEEAARAGITALIEPGGSIRDPEVVDAADRLGVALVFTGRRHFRH